MNTTSIKGRMSVGLVVVTALAVAAAGAPGAAAAEKVDGDVTVSSTETVSVLMDAGGDVNAQRVYEQLVLSGKGSVDISNPVSTKGLRNLDGFGGWDVVDDAQRIKADVDGEQKYRSVSDYTKDLPVSLDVKYTLNGKKVEPGDVVGKRGNLEVTYTVVNETGKQQDVTYTDGEGNEKTSTQAVVIPMVGSMTTTLPSTFTDVVPTGANAAGDGRGGTLLSFTLTLFPPIGSDRATFGYTAKIEDGTIPKASLSVLPVSPIDNSSFKGGAASYKGGADSGTDLTAGAVTIDENLLKIRDGANDLVDGLIQLRDGAGELNAGLADTAAPGARKLADGAGKLDDGAGKINNGLGDLAAGTEKLDDGAGTLAGGAGDLADGASKVGAGAKTVAGGASDLADGASDVDTGAKTLAGGAGAVAAGAGELNDGASALSQGLKDAGAGAPALLDGLDQLEDGLTKVNAGLTALNGSVVPGATSISDGAGQLIGALDSQIVPALSGAIQAIDGATSAANSLPEDGTKAGILTALGQAKTAVQGARGGLTGSVKPGLQNIQGGAGAIRDGVSAQLSSAATEGTILNGVAKLLGGVSALQAGGDELAAGLGALSAGADRLADGTSSLSTGADQLSTGAGDLAAGTTKLSAGAGQLSGGAGQVAGGAGEVAAGAQKLSSGAGQIAAGLAGANAGAKKLNAGAGDLKAGTGELSDGAGRLATGLDTAAEGSGKLAEGLVTAAESAPALPEGAQQLSDQGTSQLVNVGNATAMDYGLKYALIEEGSARAASAQPYGSPEGATALTAYKFDLAGATGEGSTNTKRGVAIAILAAGALALMALRRRGLLG